MSTGMSTLSSSNLRIRAASATCPSRSARRSATIALISSYLRGCSVSNARSSSSHLRAWMPSRCASGAYTSRVSFAFWICFCLPRYSISRRLCRRSPSFIRITRAASAPAVISLRGVLPRAALLALVGGGGEEERPRDQLAVDVRVVGRDVRNQLVDELLVLFMSLKDGHNFSVLRALPA